MHCARTTFRYLFPFPSRRTIVSRSAIIIYSQKQQRQRSSPSHIFQQDVSRTWQHVRGKGRRASHAQGKQIYIDPLPLPVFVDVHRTNKDANKGKRNIYRTLISRLPFGHLRSDVVCVYLLVYANCLFFFGRSVCGIRSFMTTRR